MKTFAEMASEAGVPDLGRFETCVGDTEPVPSIEADIAKAVELGGIGTPTLVVNGLPLRGRMSSGLGLPGTGHVGRPPWWRAEV